MQEIEQEKKDLYIFSLGNGETVTYAMNPQELEKLKEILANNNIMTKECENLESFYAEIPKIQSNEILKSFKCVNNHNLIKILMNPGQRFTFEHKKIYYRGKMIEGDALNQLDILVMNIVFNFMKKQQYFFTVNQIANHLKPKNSKAKTQIYADIQNSIEKLRKIRLELERGEVDGVSIRGLDNPLLSLVKTELKNRGQKVIGYEIIVGLNISEQIKNQIFITVADSINHYISLQTKVFIDSELKFTKENIELHYKLYTRIRQIKQSQKGMSDNITIESIESNYKNLSPKSKRVLRNNIEIILNGLIQAGEIENYNPILKNRTITGYQVLQEKAKSLTKSIHNK